MTTVAESSPGIHGERRVVTALFCDVVGSTAIAEHLDPEDWTELMNGAFRHLTAPIERYQGTVAKFMGDGMLAFFGSPAAHEDDPQRAVLAALDMIDAIKGFAETVKRDYGVDFNVRIGINTGAVVVADVGSAVAMEHTAMGDAVNVAARMESTAAPGTIQLSGDTYRLVAPLFDVEPLGAIQLKGKAEPTPAYRVLGLKAQPGQLRGAGGIGTRLIGRDRELTQLRQCLDQLLEGRGQIVCLIGEAGLGKSRLLAELKKYWSEIASAKDWEVMYGVPYDSSRPFALIQNYAREMFGIELDDPAEVIHDKVVATLRGKGAGDDVVALCSVAFERVIAAKVLHEAAQDFSAEQIKQDIYDQMYPGLQYRCAAVPGVWVIDDLQWGDVASIELLLHLLELTEEVAVLFLCAFRPERQSPAWRVKLKAETDYPHRYTEIVLRPLAPGDTETMVSSLLDTDGMPADLRELIMRKSDGNPYFVEEIVRCLKDQGAVEETDRGLRAKPGVRLDQIAVPDSLQALLMARIDRLDEETKSTLQMASVIGRSFYYRILQAISDSAMAIDKHLRALERVELLAEAGRMPELEYMFRHELARDAAYATILNRRRREFHLRVAQAIETLFADRHEEFAHRLAQHFEAGGDMQRALKYYEMAGEVAEGIHADDERAAHYSRALEIARQIGAPEAEIARLAAKQSASDGASAAIH